MDDVILYDRDPHYVPRVAAVHDMCGYGNCSLTAAIPILSAAGCDVCPVPTALFSAHTRYSVFTFHDTTEILDGYLDAWRKENVDLDGVYSGFLGSAEQVAIIKRLYSQYPHALRLVDPVMGDGGEIYVFDMGEPVKILDLAKKMIKLSGLEVDKDIKIVVTGLRPGEKLYEELLSDNTKTMPTYNEKILISKDPTMEFSKIDILINKMVKATLRQNEDEIVTYIKQIVPEFKSSNSVFEKLDK